MISKLASTLCKHADLEGPYAPLKSALGFAQAALGAKITADALRSPAITGRDRYYIGIPEKHLPKVLEKGVYTYNSPTGYNWSCMTQQERDLAAKLQGKQFYSPDKKAVSGDGKKVITVEIPESMQRINSYPTTNGKTFEEWKASLGQTNASDKELLKEYKNKKSMIGLKQVLSPEYIVDSTKHKRATIAEILAHARKNKLRFGLGSALALGGTAVTGLGLYHGIKEMM